MFYNHVAQLAILLFYILIFTFRVRSREDKLLIKIHPNQETDPIGEQTRDGERVEATLPLHQKGG